MNLLLWLLYFIHALVVEILCYLTNPIATIFTYREPRYDWVKRLGRNALLDRDYLWFSLWQTHDNTERERYGITEIAEPERKDESFYYVQQLDEATYVVNTPKPLE